MYCYSSLDFGSTDVGTMVTMFTTISHARTSSRCEVQAIGFDNADDNQSDQDQQRLPSQGN